MGCIPRQSQPRTKVPLAAGRSAEADSGASRPSGHGRTTMKTERKIIVSITTSVDGYIARRDGDVAWLDRPRPKGNYGMGEFFKSIDTILWGRKTYGKGIEMGMEKRMASGFGAGIQNYVFSRQAQESKVAGFKFVGQPIKEFARGLRKKRGQNIWMMGGGEIIASFLDEGEIDEFNIKVVPILIGEGIPLIQPRHRLIRLKMLSSKKFSDGVVSLRYQLARGK
jgi:dihydrofolate reductase